VSSGIPRRPGRARHPPEPGSDQGAAVVEFTLVTVVLIVLFLAILQLALALYVRNTLDRPWLRSRRCPGDRDRSIPPDRSEDQRLLAVAGRIRLPSALPVRAATSQRGTCRVPAVTRRDRAQRRGGK
jgi:hypothetical protein